MFEKTHTPISKQLLNLLSDEAVVHDTDFKDCDVYTLGCFEDELYIDTPDGRRFVLTLAQIEDAEE